MLLGLYLNYKGDILCNDCELRDLDIETFRSRIAYVPQNITVWRKSVLENIIYLRKDEEVDFGLIYDLLKIVKLEGVFPDAEHLNNIVEESGVDFSGGERQN